MTRPQYRKLNNQRRSHAGLLIGIALLVVAGLAFATMPRSAVADSSGSRTAVSNGERINNRISMRGPTAAKAHVAAANLLVFASITVDRTDDVYAASACTAAPNDCSLRGAVAFADANPGTTINVPAGTYSLNIPGVLEGFNGNDSIGDLDVTGNNTTIVGAGAGTTVIQQTQPNDRVLEINPFLDANFNFSISGVTITGGKETTAVGGGGMIAGSIGNSTSVTNCVINGNSATGVGTFGGGGLLVSGGSLTITGTTFSSNSTSSSGGGLAYTAGDPLARTPSTGTLTISGSTFSGNTANSGASGGGGADLFDFAGGSGTYSVDSSTFSSNHAPNGHGGGIIVESGPLTLTTSSLASNTAGFGGGAIYSLANASVAYSRLVGNTTSTPLNGLTLFSASGTFTANDNWWGINTGPSANDFRNSSGSLSATVTYLELRVSGSPNSVCANGTSTLTADIKQRNAGADLTTELNGLPTFAAFWTNAVLGTLSGTTNFVNGVATATYTAGGTSGSGSADVTADNQTVTAHITISANDTTNPGNQTVCEGQTASFSTTASGPGTITFVWKQGATVLNSGDLGGRVTITNGTNTSTLSISGAQTGDSGTYTVEATGDCSTASQSATLTVNASTQTTDPADQSVCQGTDAHFSTTASGTGPFHYAWTLDGSPFDGDNSSITVPTGSLSPGNHSVTVVTSGTCGTASQAATLTVTSGTPVINLSATSATMWPPNHQYQTFNVSDFVSSATAGCDSHDVTGSVVIQKVSSDEPEDNTSPSAGDGTTLNDIVIAADCKSVQLRRERDGNLNGRVYTITFKVTDSFGHTATATVKVNVPVNNNGTAIDDGAGAGYTVNGSCP